MANIRTFDQLVGKCTQACHVSPQPTHIHTPQGKPVKSLELIREGEHYIIIQSGGSYKKESLPTALVEVCTGDEYCAGPWVAVPIFSQPWVLIQSTYAWPIDTIVRFKYSQGSAVRAKIQKPSERGADHRSDPS